MNYAEFDKLYGGNGNRKIVILKYDIFIYSLYKALEDIVGENKAQEYIINSVKEIKEYRVAESVMRELSNNK